jgi:hypothetical protein
MSKKFQLPFGKNAKNSQQSYVGNYGGQTEQETVDFGGYALLQDLHAAAKAQHSSVAQVSKTLADFTSGLDQKCTEAGIAANIATAAAATALECEQTATEALNTAEDKARNTTASETAAREQRDRAQTNLENVKTYLPSAEEAATHAAGVKTTADAKQADKQKVYDAANSTVIAATAEQSARQIAYDTLKGLADGETDETVKSTFNAKANEALEKLTEVNSRLGTANSGLKTAEAELRFATQEAERHNNALLEADGKLQQRRNDIIEAETALQKAEEALTEATTAREIAEKAQADAKKRLAQATADREHAEIKAQNSTEYKETLEQLLDDSKYNADLCAKLTSFYKAIYDGTDAIDQHILQVEGKLADAQAEVEAERAALEDRETAMNTMRDNQGYRNAYTASDIPTPAALLTNSRPALPGYTGQQNQSSGLNLGDILATVNPPKRRK